MSEKPFHVMFLTRHQQCAIRLVMFDLFAKHVRMNVDRVLDDPSHDMGDTAFQSIISAADLYERITDILPTMDTFPKSKDMTMQLDPKSMDFVVKGVDLYDPENSVLTSDEKHYVSHHIEGVKKLISQSKQFTYTSEDIKRAQKGNK